MLLMSTLDQACQLPVGLLDAVEILWLSTNSLTREEVSSPHRKWAGAAPWNSTKKSCGPGCMGVVPTAGLHLQPLRRLRRSLTVLPR